MKRFILVLIGATLLALACGDGGTTPEPPDHTHPPGPHVNGFCYDPDWGNNDLVVAHGSWQQQMGDALYTFRGDGSALKEIWHTESVQVEDPAWSPDCKRVAFADVAESLKPPDIFVLEIGQKDPERLTTGGGIYPAWSPDGAELAFIAPRGEYWSQVGDLKIINVATRRVRTLVDDGDAAQPDWAPDGQHIVFVKGEPWWGPNELRQVNMAAQTTPVLSRPGEHYSYPQWSPDGSRLVFTRISGGREVAAWEKANGKVTALTDMWVCHDATWSPAGNAVAFRAEDCGAGQSGGIYVVGVYSRTPLHPGAS